MRGWWQDLTDLVLPAECGGCGRPRTVLCAKCRTALYGAAPRRVRPVPAPGGLPVVHAAAVYGGAVRAAILAHKERGALTLAGPLGSALAGAVGAALGQRGPGTGGGRVPVLLVPVPSARRAVRARGHDPARRIALAAAGELRQRRAVADQAGLDSRQRLANLAGALEVVAGCGRLLAGGRIVLVDDLMTTGASLSEAARAVRAVLDGPRTADGEVYERPAGEATGERTTEERTASAHRHGEARATGAGNALGSGLRAAVIAAPPESFETNRN
ncbi:ComF family protein [Streptomyces nodosus]